MVLASLLKNKKENPSKREKQKSFQCSHCDCHIFLQMKYCDKCGGEIEWPEEYKAVIEGKKKTSS
jgi:hypothetical protein